jgi:hypothetical protein
MRFRLLTPFIFLLIYTAPLFCQQPDPWKEYVYSDDGFAVSTPVEPKLDQSSKTRLYVSKGSSNEKMAVAVLTVIGKSDQEILDMMKQSYAKNALVAPSSIEEISFVNVPALRAQKQVGEKHYSMLSFCVGGRLFMLEVSAGPEGERFINSFRLVAAQWKEYSYPDDGFGFSSPVEPQVEKGSSSRRYTIDVPHGGFIIACMDLQPAPNVATAQKAMRRMRDGFIGKEDKLTAESVLSAEFPGIAFEYDVPSEAKHVRGRMYYAGARMYIVLAKGSPDAARFFDSFHIMNSVPK